MVDPSPAASLRESLDELQHRYLRVAFPILAGFYALLTLAHWLVLEEPLRSRMVAVAGLTATVSLLVTMVRDHAAVRRQTTFLAYLFAVLVLANAGLHLIGSGDAYQSTNLLISVVGGSILLTRAGPFAATLALAAASLGLAVWWSQADPLWMHFGFALFVTEVMSLVVFVGRRSSLRARFVAERERDEVDAQRQRHLEQLSASEASYRELVRRSPAAMVVHRDDVVLFVNLAASALIGAGDDSVLTGTRFYDLFAPDDETRIATWSARALAGALGDETVRTQLRALRGDWPIVDLAAARIRWEGEPAAILVATVVSGAREAAAAAPE